MRSLEGKTALVTGGGTPLGRAIALALSARGVRIVVTGRDEKALGLTVGEVVHGGGKARHVVGDVRDPARLAAASERALEVFGTLDILVASEATDVECIFRSPLVARPNGPTRLLAALVDATGGTRELVHTLAHEMSAKGLTCNAITVADDATADDAADDVAALAVFLCSRAGARITGQAIAVGHELRTPPGA
jgi:hypothetical protein